MKQMQMNLPYTQMADMIGSEVRIDDQQPVGSYFISSGPS